MTDCRILLIGNYALDAQQSMLRFAAALHNGLQETCGEVELVFPPAWFGRGTRATGLGKGLRYIDKYLVFPVILKRQLSKGARVVHICDHSNSVYAPIVKRHGFPLVITCHDLGAVRGALGEETNCQASRMGRILQSRILRGLGRADVVACDSTATRQDVERLVRTVEGRVPQLSTILLGQNAAYRPLPAEIAEARLGALLRLRRSQPFILHVGSSLARKNREGVMRIFARVKDRWHGNLVFAGDPLTTQVLQLANDIGISERVVEVTHPSDAVLEAFYSKAAALVFPSKFEGFGWPVIEAQACGCPVLCSNSGSLSEVAGDSAFVAHWKEEGQFADELIRIVSEEARRQHWRKKGFANVLRFETGRMINEYKDLYSSLTEVRPHSRGLPLLHTNQATPH